MIIDFRAEHLKTLTAELLQLEVDIKAAADAGRLLPEGSLDQEILIERLRAMLLRMSTGTWEAQELLLQQSQQLPLPWKPTRFYLVSTGPLAGVYTVHYLTAHQRELQSNILQTQYLATGTIRTSSGYASPASLLFQPLNREEFEHYLDQILNGTFHQPKTC